MVRQGQALIGYTRRAALRLLSPRFPVAVLAVLVGGCSFSYVDSGGIKHVIGLVDIAVDTEADRFQNGGKVIEVTTIGLSIYDNPSNSGVAVGYNRDSITLISGNACVAVNSGDLSWFRSMTKKISRPKPKEKLGD